MKLLAIMNGWRDASHCWNQFLLVPFWIKKYHQKIWQIEVAGFVFFVEVL